MGSEPGVYLILLGFEDIGRISINPNCRKYAVDVLMRSDCRDVTPVSAKAPVRSQHMGLISELICLTFDRELSISPGLEYYCDHGSQRACCSCGTVHEAMSTTSVSSGSVYNDCNPTCF